MVLLIGLTVAVAGFAEGQQEDGGDQMAETPTANLTYVNWEEGVAWTHLVQTILEDEMGYDVSITAADVGPAYASVASGDQDAFMEAWLPGLHASYMDEYGDQLVDLGIIYEDAVSGWVVPQYMIDDGVTSISDLRDEAVAERLEYEITGIDSGAGVMITSREEAIPSYGLDEVGYELVPSSGPAMMAALERAVQNEEYIVVTGWQPHSMFGMFDLALLEQDEEEIWGTDNIHIIGSATVEEEKPELAEFLGNLRVTTGEIGALMVAIRESEANTLEAAREWKNNNQDVWQDWIPGN
jgi:glycine betaine/proline transport system substrate-binding protein